MDPALAVRPLRPGDGERLRELHEEWYPLRYGRRFYADVVQGRFDGEPLFTEVVLRPATEAEARLEAAPRVAAGPEASPQAEQDPAPEAEEPGALLKPPPGDDEPSLESRRIVGALTAAMQAAGECEYDAVRRIAAPHRRALYVMTLGCDAAHRRQGIATQLLRHCVAHARADPACGVVYLHVITYNEAAIQFYARYGFRLAHTARDFYVIDGRNYDAHVYVLYVNGCEAPEPWSLLRALGRPLWAVAGWVAGWVWGSGGGGDGSGSGGGDGDGDAPAEDRV